MFYPDFLDLWIDLNHEISKLDLYIYTYYVCLYGLLTVQSKKYDLIGHVKSDPENHSNWINTI